MKTTKNFLIALSLILTVFFISACFPTDKLNSADESSTDRTVEITEPDTAELIALYGEPVELTADMIPEAYQAEINDKISINACVSKPAEIPLAKFIADENTFSDRDSVCKCFIDGEVKKEESEDGTITYYYGNDSSAVFVARTPDAEDSVNYYNGEPSFINRGITNVETEGFNSYFSFIKGENTLVNPAAGDFFKEEEIEGLSRENAVDIVKEKINALGIECETKPDVFVIDSEGVAAYRENRKEKHPDLTIDDTPFTSEDNAYFIIFNLTCNGMSITKEGWYSITGDKVTAYDSAYVYAAVNSKGILQFYANAGYTFSKPADEKLEFYNVDILEKVLKSNFNSANLDGKYDFIIVNLEYVCTSGTTSDRKNLIFEPCWVCTYHNKYELNGKPMDTYNKIFIKARTGELMNTDGKPII